MNTLDYGGLMDAEERRLRPATSSGAKDYGVLMDGEDQLRRQRLISSLVQARAANPDEYARVVKAAGAIGVPADAVEGAPEDAQMALIAQHADTILKSSPVLARQLGDIKFAKLAHDDTESLSLVERAFSTYFGASVKSGLESLLGVGAKLIDTLNPFTLSEQDAAVLYKNDPAKLAKMRAESPAMALSRFAAAMQQASQETMRGISPEAHDAYGRLKYATLDPKQAAYLSPVRMVSDAIQSLPTSLALAASIYFTKGAAARAEQQAVASGATAVEAQVAAVKTAAETMAKLSAASEGVIGYAQQANQTREQANEIPEEKLAANPNYRELLARGFSPEAARVWLSAKAAEESGLMGGAADAIVSYFGGRYLGRIIGEGGKLAPRMLRGAATEASTEAVQSGIEQAAQNAAIREHLDPSQNLADQVLENIVQGFFVGGLTGGTFTAMARRARHAETALRDSQALAALYALAGASKLRGRAAGEFGRFVDALGQEHEVPELYVDARAFVDALHQSGLDPAQVAGQTPSVATQLEQAIATQGDIQIPVGEWAATIAGTDAGKALLPHVRTQADGMSEAEAKQFFQDQATVQALQEDIQRFTSEVQALNANAQQGVDAVRQHLMQQLEAAGRFTPEVNAAYSNLVASFYHVMGQRLGESAEALLQRYPLHVVADLGLSGPGILANILEQSHKSDIGHRREDTTGRYVGAPDWVGNSPPQLAALRSKLRRLALEGELGRLWYERSSKAILDLVGGDKSEAEKLVSLFAIYSPNNTVTGNTAMALSAYYQWKAGLPIKAGLGLANKKAEELLREDKSWSGIKTNSFYQNLMEEIDPSKNAAQNATMDMWMAIAFDYGQKKIDIGDREKGAPKYRFMEREIKRLAQELGWKPHQAQAAIWTAMRSRVDQIRDALKARELKLGIGHIEEKNGEEIYKIDKPYEHYKLAHRMAMGFAFTHEHVAASKYDFADAIASRMVQISWEATPGESTEKLPSIFGAPIDQQVEYLRAVSEVINPNGKDLIAEAVGLPAGHTVFGYSAWKGAIGAGAQTFTAAPSKGSGKAKAVKPEARQLLNLYAAMKGYVLSQEAVVWHQPVYDDLKARHNGVEIFAPRGLTAEEMKLLYTALNEKFATWELAPGYTESGARILNFVEGLDNKRFHAGVEEILVGLPAGFGGGEVGMRTYRSDGEYISNDWKENPNGESYQATFTGAGRPDLQERAADLRARVEAVNKQFEEKYGWDRPAAEARQPDAPGSAGQVAPEQLLQSAAGSARGAFDPDTKTIALLKNADLSTFLHEAGHFYLEVLTDIAVQPGAPVQIATDANTVMQWLGVPDLAAWRAMTLDDKRAAHEKFARGFEVYLFGASGFPVDRLKG